MKKLVLVFLFCLFTLLLPGCSVSQIPTDANAKSLYNSLEKIDISDLNQKSSLSVDKENLQSLINSFKKPPAYTWEAQVSYVNNGKKLIYNTKQYAYDNKIRCEKYNENYHMLQFSLFLNNATYIIDNQTREYFIEYGTNQLSPNLSLNIPDPLSIIKTTDLDNFSSISADYLNDENIIYFEINDPSLLSVDKYWISINSGIPLKIESTIEGGAQYSLNTILFKTEVNDTSIFNLPYYVY